MLTTLSPKHELAGEAGAEVENLPWGHQNHKKFSMVLQNFIKLFQDFRGGPPPSFAPVKGH